MNDSVRRFRDLDALTGLAADRLRLLEQMRPTIDLIRQHEKILQPFREVARRYEEAMRPMLEAASRHEESIRPFLEAAKRHEQAFRQLRESLQFNAPALALAGQLQVPQLQIAETLGKTMSLSGVVDQAERISALTERWRAAFEGFGDFSQLASTNVFADMQRLAESVRRSMPTVPVLDPSFFSSTASADLAYAFARLLKHTESLADDPEAGVEDVEALAAEAEAVNATARADARSKVNGYLLLIFLWLLDKAAEDPAKELIHNAIATLILVLTTVLPPVTPPHSALPVPAIEATATPRDAERSMAGLGWQVDGLPDIIRRAGPQAERAALQFLNDGTRSPNTKQAYANAVMKFLDWCDDRALNLVDITPFVVRAYIKQMQREYAPATLKQHLAALRLLFDHFVAGAVLPINPAASVRVPEIAVKPRRSGAAVLQPAEARRLVDSIDLSDRSGLRDRALLGVMLHTRARVSAILGMDVKDYREHEGRRWVRLHERGGKTHDVPMPVTVQGDVNAYVESAGIGGDENSPLWRTMTKERSFSGRRMSRIDVFRMIRRRVRDAGLEPAANCDSLRVSGGSAGEPSLDS